MICSEDELGLATERASGILRLEEFFFSDTLKKQLGKPFYDLEIDIPGLH